MASENSIRKISLYVLKYREKTGTSGHPDRQVEEAVIEGLSANMDEVGKPLCPCNFYPDKKAEANGSRRWLCACDEMKQYKFCHCLLFTRPDGLPITEYLPDDHEGRKIYGHVEDPTPDRGRESRKEG